jgi:hypothetical protein
LLARGYALAGSARKSNGYSLEDGWMTSAALVSYFRRTWPCRLAPSYGGLLGGMITLETAERNGGAFDGYLPINPGGAGPRGTSMSSSSSGSPTMSPSVCPVRGDAGDVRDDLTTTEVLPILPLRPSTRQTSVDSSSSGW